jgi:hypothetical protein
MVGVSAPRRLGSADGSIHHAQNPVSINDAAHQFIQWATTLREDGLVVDLAEQNVPWIPPL